MVAQSRRGGGPQGHWEDPWDALLYPEILSHHLTPDIGRKKVNVVGAQK